MASEEAFNAARDLIAMSLTYLRAVGEEIGMERALDIAAKSAERTGVQWAQRVKEAGLRGDDARAAGWAATKIFTAWGLESKPLEVSPQKIVAENGRCPVYDACVMVGMDPKSYCRVSTRAADAMFKQINPNLSQQCLKFRSSAYDTCIEAIVMGEPFKFPE